MFKYMIIVLAVLFFLPTFAATEDLSFVATGLEKNSGQVLCTLYNSEDTWLEETDYVATVSATPHNGQATCVFEPNHQLRPHERSCGFQPWDNRGEPVEMHQHDLAHQDTIEHGLVILLIEIQLDKLINHF